MGLIHFHRIAISLTRRQTWVQFFGLVTSRQLSGMIHLKSSVTSISSLLPSLLPSLPPSCSSSFFSSSSCSLPFLPISKLSGSEAEVKRK